MTGTKDEISTRFMVRMNRLAGPLMFILGLSVLIGWLFDLPLLTSIRPEYVSMKPNTAICFVLLGLSVLWFNKITQVPQTTPETPVPGSRPVFSQKPSLFAALLVFLLGTLSLAQYVFDTGLGIDELFIPDRSDAMHTYSPGRMALESAAGFIFLSVSMLLLHLNRTRSILVAQLIALFIALYSIMPTLGYIYNATALFSYGGYTRMALHTAVGLMVGGLGVLAARPDQGIVAVMTSGGQGGYLARRLIPVSVLLPLLMLWGSLLLSPTGFHWPASDPSVFFTVLISLLVLLSWIISDSLQRMDVRKRQAEAELYAGHELMRYIIQHDPNAIAVQDTDLRYIFVSERYLSDYNLKRRDIIGKHHYAVFPDIPEKWKEVHRRALAGEVLGAEEDEFERLDGTKDYVRWECRPWYKPGGQTGGIILYTEVITRRKMAENEIRAKNEFINTVLDNLPIGLALNTINEGSALYVNKMFEEIYGWPKEVLKDIDSFFHSVYPDKTYRDAIKDKVMNDIRSGDPQRMQWDNILITRKDGSQGIINARNIPLREQNTMVSTVMDITIRKQAELQLLEMNRQLSGLVATIKELARVHTRGHIRQIMKTAAEELAHADGNAFAKYGETLAADSEADSRNMEGLWPAGRKAPGELDRQILQTLADAASIALENVGLYEELEQRVNQRTRELEEVNKNLEVVNRELEAFSYSVSHDLRAPLRAIDGFGKMLEEDYGDVLDENARRICGVIRDNSRKMGQLIDDLLAFSRLGRTEIRQTAIDMTAMAGSVFQELSAGQGSIHFELADLPPATGDAAMIRQVWTNLLSNALKFSSRSEAAGVVISGSIENGMCHYKVCDNGVGFDMQYAGKIFGVFERLHSPREFEGTGVGLAIVERIVHKHGGKVSAWSGQGKGACFTFTLPINPGVTGKQKNGNKPYTDKSNHSSSSDKNNKK